MDLQLLLQHGGAMPHQAGRSTRPQAKACAEGSRDWALGQVGSGLEGQGLVPGSRRLRSAHKEAQLRPGHSPAPQSLGWLAPAGAECPGEAQQPGGARRGALAEVKDPPQRRNFSNSYTAGEPPTEPEQAPSSQRGVQAALPLSCPHPAQASPRFTA